jgi:anion-transporting  ArsA/GET3 family ATPase
MTSLESLAQRRLLVVTGKGGVGKTIIAGALGRAMADLGRHVLLLEVDPRENLHQAFDVPPSGGEVVRVTPHLSLQNLQPHHVIAALVRQHLHVAVLSRRVIDSPVFQHFVEGAPGLKELAILSHAERVTRVRGRRRAAGVDLVVLDAPASGHGLTLLRAPRLVSEVIARGPIGDEARQLAALVAEPEQTGVVVVTLAEEVPVQETMELNAALEAQVGRSANLLVVNALYPPFPDTAIAPGDDGLLMHLWQTRRRVNEEELARLGAWWPGPRLDLPMLPADRGPALLAALTERVRAQMGQTA